MLLFGHIGIGKKLAQPFSKGFDLRWVMFGTLVPDLIDKPLYYGLKFIYGVGGAELGLISGTRTFGHTAIILIVFSIFALIRKAKLLGAMAIGAATHLLLDNVLDRMLTPALESSAFLALIFPFQGLRFGVAPHHSLSEHLQGSLHPILVGCEVIGLLILIWDHWGKKHSKLYSEN